MYLLLFLFSVISRYNCTPGGSAKNGKESKRRKDAVNAKVFNRNVV